MIVHLLRESRGSVVLLVSVGNLLTCVGILVLFLGSVGLVSFDSFALGLSSGIRNIAMIAITGCLLSAIGYGIQDYFKS